CSHGCSAAQPVEGFVSCDPAPEGQRCPPRLPSFEHILLIEFNTVSAKEAEKLRLEVLFLMMFGLPAMYFFTDSSCDLLTEKTLYPSCQANAARLGNVSCTHFDDLALTVRIRSETEPSGRQRRYRCT